MRFSFLRVWIITNGETTMPLRPHSEAGGWSQTYAYDNFGNRAVLTGVVNPYATPRATSQYTNNRWLSPKKDSEHKLKSWSPDGSGVREVSVPWERKRREWAGCGLPEALGMKIFKNTWHQYLPALFLLQ
jgi:hypothetical protein